MHRALRMCVAAAYCLLIVYGSLVPLDFQPLPLDEAVDRFKNINDLDINVHGRADLVANLLLYIPLGLLLAYSLAPRRSSYVLCGLAVLVAAAASAGIAVGVEFLQLWFPARTVSLNDLRAEIVGGIVGALSYVGARALSSRFSFQSLVRHWSVSRVGFAYFAGMLAFSLLPGDFVLSKDEFHAKLADGRVQLVPFAEVTLDAFSVVRIALHVASFVPIGYWLAHLFQPINAGGSIRPRALFGALTAGAGVAILNELVQLAVFTRFSTTTAVITGTLGTTCGVALQMLTALDANSRPAWLRSVMEMATRRRTYRVAAFLISAAIVVLMLAPFHVATAEERAHRWQLFRQPLFAAMYVSTEFAALTNILHKGLPFFVLGAAMARSTDPSPPKSAFAKAVVMVAYAALLGGGIEVAQVYLDVHQPDLTDVLIYALAAATGVAVVYQIRAR